MRSASLIVCCGVLFIERVLKVDDPCGAVSVHGLCGWFGAVAVGIFADGTYGAGWNGVGAPKNTPAKIVERLNKEINAALADAKMKVRLAQLGTTPFMLSSTDFGKFIADETEKWSKVIRVAGIKAN